jgi:hypothetical protein
MGGKATRNSLMNEPVVTLDDRDSERTDILHEYFVPPERFAEFIDACQEVIPSSNQEMLNTTLRYVKADRESVLSFAPEQRVSAVMSFSQEKSVRAEEDMTRMTRELIDRVGRHRRHLLSSLPPPCDSGATGQGVPSHRGVRSSQARS